MPTNSRGYTFSGVTLTSANGTKFNNVNSEYSDRFQGLINDLDARGYQFSQAGGAGAYADRLTASGNVSAHGYGIAMDINPLDNPNKPGAPTNLPSDIGDIAAKNGLAWGGADKFGNPDAMHFEVPGVQGSTVKSPGQWNSPDDTAKMAAYNQKSGFSTPLDPSKPMSNGPTPGPSKTTPDGKNANGATTASSAGVPPKAGQNDIQGTTGAYTKTQTQTISSIMPTHEPWPGHPKSNLPPRQAVEGGGAGTSGSSGSSDGTNTGTNGGTTGGTTSSPGTGTVGTNGQPLSGKSADTIKQSYDYLTNVKGISSEGAKAIIANTMGEGLLTDWTKVSNDVNGPSSGIAQWHSVTGKGGGRYEPYAAYMASKPGGAASLTNQLDYLVMDLQNSKVIGGGGVTVASLNNTLKNGTAEQGVAQLVAGFERPRNVAGEIAKRTANIARINATLAKIDKTGDNGVNPNAQNQKPSKASTTGTQDSPSQSSGTSTTPNASTSDNSGKGTTTDDSSTTQTSTTSTSTTPSTASTGTSGGLSNVAGSDGALQATFKIKPSGTGINTGS